MAKKGQANTLISKALKTQPQCIPTDSGAKREVVVDKAHEK